MKTKLLPQQRLPRLVKIVIPVGADGIDGDADLVERFDETVQNHATFAETRNEIPQSYIEPDNKIFTLMACFWLIEFIEKISNPPKNTPFRKYRSRV